MNTAFGAVLLAGSAGDPRYLPDAHHLAYVTLGGYVKLVHDLGSPAYSVAEIHRQPLDYQQIGDAALVGAEHVAPVTATGDPPAGARCSSSEPGTSAQPLTLTVAPGHTMYVRAPANSPLAVSLRRVSRAFPSPPQETLAAGRAFSLTFPHDASTMAWHLQISETQRDSTKHVKARHAACVATLG